TSGAFIPGHGTPTVILFGRARRPVGAKVRVVMGILGEPTTPEVAALGLVWASIAAHHGDAGYKDEFISVADIERTKLAAHPWSLGGGGAAELKERLHHLSTRRLGDLVKAIGRTTHTGEDHAFSAPADAFERLGIPPHRHVPLVEGELVRDHTIGQGDHCY